MVNSLSLAPLFLSCLTLVTAWDINNNGDRRNCQDPARTAKDGCDADLTYFVSATDPGSDFLTVQSAIDALPNNSVPYVILIGPGTYREQINVTRQGPTYLLGQTAHPQNYTLNTANIVWAADAGTGDNAFSSTLTVAPNLNASLTGSGPTGFAVPDDTPFGCVDFRTYNLNFINDFAPYSVTPALALSISRANGGFYHTGFYSYQDTVYVGKLGNAFMKDGEVAGQTDFFYGFGTLWATGLQVTLRSCGGGITAWKGTNTTFLNKYGVYIVDSTVNAANSSIAPHILNRCALGRPWNSQMRAIFSNTYLDASILPTGYIDWNPSRYDSLTLQAEFENFGPGFNATARATALFDVQLTRAQWSPYNTPAEVFQFPDNSGNFGNDAWVDYHA